MWMILALNVMAQTTNCPSMQGEWTCRYRKNPEQTWPMTITESSGSPLAVQVRSFIDGEQPSTFVADGESRTAPANFGVGKVRSEPHANRCGGIKSVFEVETKGVATRIEQYLYPERGGIVRIFRKVQPLEDYIPEISCKPVIKPKRPSETTRPPG